MTRHDGYKWTPPCKRYKIKGRQRRGQKVRQRVTSHDSRISRLVRGVLLLLVAIPVLSIAQGRFAGGIAEVPYNGGFTFTRIRYGSGFSRRGGGSWAHDYPSADANISKIIQYVSLIPINVSGTNVFDLDDPEIFRHPIIYISEPGFWGMTDEEGVSLRKYLLKGGFVILDDFEAEQWYNMEEQLRRAMPDHRLIEIGPDHPIFTSFYRLDNIYVPHPYVTNKPQYFALFEDNDPKKRMMALVNYNSDLAEYWEYSDDGFLPMAVEGTTNEAYKLGVNYIYYAIVH